MLLVGMPLIQDAAHLICHCFDVLLVSYAIDLQILCQDLWSDLLPHEAVLKASTVLPLLFLFQQWGLHWLCLRLQRILCLSELMFSFFM